jgi:hypothetical protein
VGRKTLVATLCAWVRLCAYFAAPARMEAAPITRRGLGDESRDVSRSAAAKPMM